MTINDNEGSQFPDGETKAYSVVISPFLCIVHGL